MSTRLTKNDITEVQNKLLAVLDSGIRFFECPLSDEEKGIFWHKGFPDDILDAYSTLNDHGVGVEYSATTRAVGFVVPSVDGTKGNAVRLCMVEANRGFFTITHKMMNSWPKAKLKDDSYSNWPVITHDTLKERLGPEMYESFMEWVKGVSIMDEEIYNAQKVIEDLFKMIKTAGQLKRMVPDLFQWLPQDVKAAFEDQQRASSVPFEWAAYDRASVHKMIETFHKCSLLTGLEKPSMAKAKRDDDTFSWATEREIESLEFPTAESNPTA